MPSFHITSLTKQAQATIQTTMTMFFDLSPEPAPLLPCILPLARIQGRQTCLPANTALLQYPVTCLREDLLVQQIIQHHQQNHIDDDPVHVP